VVERLEKVREKCVVGMASLEMNKSSLDQTRPDLKFPK
jgi:hypothetical protein